MPIGQAIRIQWFKKANCLNWNYPNKHDDADEFPRNNKDDSCKSQLIDIRIL